MSESKLEVIGITITVCLATISRLYTEEGFGVYIGMLAGTLAGAFLATFAGKSYGFLDAAGGLPNPGGKMATHFAVSVIFCPRAMEMALERWPEAHPLGLAPLVGGCIALFGSNILINVAPLLPNAIKWLLWKIIPQVPPVPNPPPQPAIVITPAPEPIRPSPPNP